MSHVAEVELTRGWAGSGRRVLPSAAGSASRPDAQLDIGTWAAMKSVGLAGLVLGTQKCWDWHQRGHGWLVGASRDF